MKSLWCLVALFCALRGIASAGAYPTVRANSGQSSSATLTTALSVSLASAVANNTDAVFIFFKTLTSTCSISAAPSGFTQLFAVESTTNTECAALYYANGGQNGNTTFAFTIASAKYAAIVEEIQGQNTTTLIDQNSVAENASSATQQTNTVTVTQPFELGLSFFTSNSATATWTPTGAYSNVQTVAAANLLASANQTSITATTTFDKGTAGSAAVYVAAIVTIFSASFNSYGVPLTGAGR